MSAETFKKPELRVFRKVVADCGGNLTKVANVLGVSRGAVYLWQKEDKDFAKVVKGERLKLFDECLTTARTLSLGIPIYENVYDDEGNPVYDANGRPKKVFAGWQERPDGQMVRYLMSTIGRAEGFGDSPVDESDGTVKSGVPIRAWIMKMNEGEEE